VTDLMLRWRWMPVALVAGVAAIAVYAYGFEASSLQDRLVRHVLASVVQVLSPLVAGIGCLVATRAYTPGDRERGVWTVCTLATVAWAVGRALFAFRQWWGGTAVPYPSTADAFFAAFYLLLAVALAIEVRLVLPMLERPLRLGLTGLGLLGWYVGFLYVLEPILASGATPTQKLLAFFYPTVAVFLVPAGLAPALGFRGGASAAVWLTVALAAVCLAAASLGYAFLTWYGLYSDVHSVNALWVAGFMLLGIGGFWQRAVQEEV
jgi:hypothetical protein